MEMSFTKTEMLIKKCLSYDLTHGNFDHFKYNMKYSNQMNELLARFEYV